MARTLSPPLAPVRYPFMRFACRVQAASMLASMLRDMPEEAHLYRVTETRDHRFVIECLDDDGNVVGCV